MGCDGGTIPTRDELVRLKKKPEQKDKDAERAAKWKLCAITQEPLQQPIVACGLGKLYKKETILELLLDRTKFECAASFDHIRGLKDIKVMNLSDNPAYVKPVTEKGDVLGDQQVAAYICPISGLEMNGKHRFSYLDTCGCVFSERALKEVRTDICTKCGKTYTSDDIIPLNGTDEEVEGLKSRLEARRLQAKMEKKAKKKSAPTVAEGSIDVPTKQAKLEKTVASTSRSNGIVDVTEKLTNGSAKLTKQTAAKSIQKDATTTPVYKSLFTTCEAAKRQQKAHWVTYNPQYN